MTIHHNEFLEECAIFDIQSGGGGGGGSVSSVNNQTPDGAGNVYLDSDNIPQGTENIFATNDGGATDNLVDLPTIVNLQSEIDAIPPAPVTSVNGQIGDVVLDSDDIAQGSANWYATQDGGATDELATLPTVVNLQNEIDGITQFFPDPATVYTSSAILTKMPYAIITNFSASGQSIKLPSVKGMPRNYAPYLFGVPGSQQGDLLDYDGNLIQSITPNYAAQMILDDNSTDAGTWFASRPDVISINGQFADVNFDSADGSVVITPQPNNKIDLSVSGIVVNQEAYAGFSSIGNTAATSIAAQNTLYPISLDNDSTFNINTNQNFVVEFVTISGVSTPCLRCTASTAAFYDLKFAGALFDTSGISEINVYPTIYTASSLIVNTKYIATASSLNDQGWSGATYLNSFSGSGLVQLSNGDRVFFQIENVTLSTPNPVTIKNFNVNMNLFNQSNTSTTPDMQEVYDQGSTVALNNGQPVVYSCGSLSYSNAENLIKVYSTFTTVVSASTMYGMAFTASKNGQFTQLGYRDASFPSGTREVGLWKMINNTTGILIASATVAKTDPLDPTLNQYRMHNITPVPRENGQRYAIGALSLAGDLNPQYQIPTINNPSFGQLDGTNFSGFASATLAFPQTLSLQPASTCYGCANLTAEDETGYQTTDTTEDKSISDTYHNFDSNAQSNVNYGIGTIAQRNAITPQHGMGWIDTNGATYVYNSLYSMWQLKSLGTAIINTTLVTLAPNVEHFIYYGGLVTCQLPKTFEIGTVFKIVCSAGPGQSNAFNITQNANGAGSAQRIFISNVGSSSVGMSGSVQSSTDFAIITLTCIVADTVLVGELQGGVTFA